MDVLIQFLIIPIVTLIDLARWHLREHKWLQWIPTSMKALIDAEIRLFKGVTSRIRARYLPVRLSQGQVWTITVTNEDIDDQVYHNRTPLVLVHGFGGGVAVWVQNLDSLATNRPVHAFDLLGFGRSSRPQFSRDPTLVELEWVQSIEDWRKAVGIDTMILLGHSFGGFLASSYALEYPNRVRHLILADPWGFPSRPLDAPALQTSLPAWVRAVGHLVSWFNPLASIRIAGPFGQYLVRRFRPDMGRRYASLSGDFDAFHDYVYHCNSQRPSGETAFRNLSTPFGWARRPMLDRLPSLAHTVPASFVYGSKSWIDPGPGFEMQRRLCANSYVSVQMIPGAGHHLYADSAHVFDEIVNEICDLVDNDRDYV